MSAKALELEVDRLNGHLDRQRAHLLRIERYHRDAPEGDSRKLDALFQMHEYEKKIRLTQQLLSDAIDRLIAYEDAQGERTAS